MPKVDIILSKISSFHRFVSLSVFALYMIGCGTANSTSDPTLITPQVSQSVPNVGDIEISSTPNIQFSVTPAPNITPYQTQLTINQTMTVAVQAVSVLQTKIAQFPHVCTENYVYPHFPGRFSPNGLWLEELCYSENDQDLILTISNKDTRVAWKLIYKDFIHHNGFPPDGGMLVIHWTDDGKFAYFNSYTSGDGGECFVNGYDSGRGLFRLDLQSGQTVAILPPNMEDLLWYGFSFSPTDRRLVYGARSRALKILDIQTGQTISIVHAKELNQTGGYTWSPDGLELVFSSVAYNFQEGTANYSLRWVDVHSGSERILIESDTDCYVARAWNENRSLLVERYDENYNSTLITYDLNLNSISETTTTP